MTECFRCGTSIAQPVTSNADYVIGEDTVETEEREAFYAMKHTDETWARLEEVAEKFPNRDKQALAAEMAHPDADDTREADRGHERVENDDGSFVQTAVTEEVSFSVPVDDFDHVEVDTPNVVQDDPDVAFTYTVYEEREVTKTGLVCPDCTRDDDEIIWGVSS